MKRDELLHKMRRDPEVRHKVMSTLGRKGGEVEIDGKTYWFGPINSKSYYEWRRKQNTRKKRAKEKAALRRKNKPDSRPVRVLKSMAGVVLSPFRFFNSLKEWLCTS